MGGAWVYIGVMAPTVAPRTIHTGHHKATAVAIADKFNADHFATFTGSASVVIEHCVGFEVAFNVVVDPPAPKPGPDTSCVFCGTTHTFPCPRKDI